MGVRTTTMPSIINLALCLCIVVHAAALRRIESATVTIAPGVHQPLVNLGGVTSKPSNYSSWLTVGGRGLDTALTYGDTVQQEVAAAMDSSSVPRDQIFLTTKIPCCPFSLTKSCSDPEFGGTAAQSIARDIKLLGRPVDLLL